ncbi:MAG: MarR family transcriptional regulator [Pseudomonadota bacterium]|nr:MarR family transcriptional regulator [Pseudomonadota bacterium]
MKIGATSTDPTPKQASGSLLLGDQMCFALYAASNGIIRAYRAPLAKLGLTYPQYLAMLVLWEHGEQTVKSLATRLDLDSSTITPLVKRLAVAGLVHRERDPANERNLKIELTAAGRALHAPVAKVQQRVACQTGLGPDEFTVLKAQLHALTQKIAKALAQPAP